MQRRTAHHTALPVPDAHGSNSTTTTTNNHSSNTEKDPSKRRKVRRKAILSAWTQFRYELAKHMEEDGPFMLLVGFMGCVLIGMIGIVAWKLMRAVLGSSSTSYGYRYRRSSRSEAAGVTDDAEEHEPIPFNPIYHVPEASQLVGDRTNAYAKLRLEMDTNILPVNHDRSLAFAQSQRMAQFTTKSMEPHHSDQIMYDIHNCPHSPPPGYPLYVFIVVSCGIALVGQTDGNTFQQLMQDNSQPKHSFSFFPNSEWHLTQILEDWPANQMEIPDQIHQGLCVFDYQKDYAKALNYRNLELPFVVENDPEVARTVERWHQPGYVEKMVGPNVRHRAEYNKNNHFLFATPAGGNGVRAKRAQEKRLAKLKDNQGRHAQLQNEAMVAETLRMTYGDWLKHANVTNVGPDDEHWYFRLIGCGFMGADGDCDYGSTEALFDELPFFQPKANLYIGDPEEQKGIHCRFGMEGVIAENHFDGSRNSIAVFMGKRRYVLAHPKNCDKLTLLPMKHPSARHSAIDYTNPDLETFPEFKEAMSNEVVLQPGQVLYLPTNWFHFIVSLVSLCQCCILLSWIHAQQRRFRTRSLISVSLVSILGAQHAVQYSLRYYRALHGASGAMWILMALGRCRNRIGGL